MLQTGEEFSAGELIDTIKIPKQKTLWNERLPKPNYDSRLQRHATQTRSLQVSHSNLMSTSPKNHKSQLNHCSIVHGALETRKIVQNSPNSLRDKI